MKKIKEFWQKKNSTQKKEFVFRILKQLLFAVICMTIGSLIGFKFLSKLFIFVAIPIIFTFLGYYLGRKSNQEEKNENNPTKTTNIPKKK